MKHRKGDTMSFKLGGLVVVLGALAIAARAEAAGFQVNEHGAAAMGRANAVTATIDDASALYHNPAAMTSIEGTEFQLGVTLIAPHGQYTGRGFESTNPSGAIVTQEASSQMIPVPNIYAVRALSSKAFVGLGMYLPYGLRVEWEDPNFVGRSVAEQADLRSFFITPAIALKLSEMFSVAVSVSLVPATVYIKRAIATEDGQLLFPASQYGTEGTIELSGSAFGVGANVALQATLWEKMKVGFVFRSAVDLSVTGNVNFTVPESVPSEIKARFPDGPADASLTLPHSFNLGIGYVDGPLTLEAGAQLTLWQAFEELRINLGRRLPSAASVAPRNWKATPLFKGGGEYRFDKLKFRAGLGYDFSPAPTDTLDPTLPDANRFYMTAGAGYQVGPIVLDASYMLLLTETRVIDSTVESKTFTQGTFTGGPIHLIGISLGAKL